MLCIMENQNEYTIKILHQKTKIDIFNQKEINNLIKKIYLEHLKPKKIKGKLDFEIYIDKYNGIIIKIINNIHENKQYIEVKINFHLNSIFLYQIDYFSIENIKKYALYYYKNKFYLELKKPIDKSIYLELLETNNIIYGEESLNIINNAIKIK